MDKFVTITQTGKRTLVTSSSAPSRSMKQSPQPTPRKVVEKASLATHPVASSVSPLDAKEAQKPSSANIINVFTDGSCIQNGKGKKQNRPAGFACVFPDYPSFNYASKLQGSEKTNNRAEFSACIAAFQIADHIDPKTQKLLYVYTDSELLINSVTKWLPGWKAKNWKKADGSPVKNVDLLKVLEESMKKRVVVFRHVRAHTGKRDWQSIHNDMADKLAKQAALS